MYRVLTGTLPPESTERVKTDTLRPLSAFGVTVLGNVEKAITKALCVEAADRYQTIDEFSAALSYTGFKTPFSLKKAYEPLTEILHSWAKMEPRLTGAAGIYAGQVFRLDQDVIFGRDPDACNIVFPPGTPGVSRVQCQICLNVYGQRAVLIDCDSTYGTFLNGIRLFPGQPTVLQNGSRISFGGGNEFDFSL